jgi:alanyl-tRNA synthetase
MTERLFREDPYLLTFDARVVDVQAADGQFIVFLDRTAFFAECGGQPCDTGVLAGIPVRDVQEDGELIRHTLDAPLKIGSVVKGVVDSDRRRDHRQQHHGQHLLSRALLDQSNARTVSFHLGGDACTIDLDRTLNSSAIEEAEQLVNETIWRALPVSSREVSRSEAGALGIRIPERAGDRIRIVDAEGFDVQACSGTHPRSTAEVGVVLILRAENYKGGTRLRFTCGHRALGAWRQRTLAIDRLGVLFSAPTADLVDAAEKQTLQCEDAGRQIRALRQRALRGDALELLRSAPPSQGIILQAFDDMPAEDLRTLAETLVALEPCLALLGSRAEKAHLVFAQSPGQPHDVPALLKAALTVLGGRGGGRGDIAQGGGPETQKLDEALHLAKIAASTP